jgi:hypothetical protein
MQPIRAKRVRHLGIGTGRGFQHRVLRSLLVNNDSPGNEIVQGASFAIGEKHNELTPNPNVLNDL